MNARQKARVEMFKRANAFGHERASLFVPKAPATGPTHAQELFSELQGIVSQIVSTRTRQDNAAPVAGTTDKASLRDALQSDMRAIARSVGYLAAARREPAWIDRFRIPAGGSDEKLITRARSFAEALRELGLAQDLVKLEHESDVIEVLEARIAEFAGAESEQDTAVMEKTGATANLASLIENGLICVRGLNAIIGNKFKGSAETLGEWKTASHVERTGERPRVPVAALPVTASAAGATGSAPAASGARPVTAGV